MIQFPLITCFFTLSLSLWHFGYHISYIETFSYFPIKPQIRNRASSVSLQTFSIENISQRTVIL